MRIKEVNARKIENSRKEETIEILIRTENGLFSASAPSGKSKGKYETPDFVSGVNESIKKLIDFSEKIKEIEIEKFEDLEKVEAVVGKNFIGANTLYALETAILKALALERGKALWQVINDKAKLFPVPVGNCVGGGMHTPLTSGKKPDFQEFLILPRGRKIFDSVFIMKEAYRIIGEKLKLRNAKGGLNDESAFSTSLTNEEVLEILDNTRDELSEQADEKIEIGFDAAASGFFTGLVYDYKNPVKRRNIGEQKRYLAELVEKFRIGYVEDPFQQEAFSDFKELREKVKGIRPCLIVGDDLTASQLDRLNLALKNKSINAIIVKPNQNGSLIEIKKLIQLAKKYNITTIMSHRSGETLDYSLADLAFGFQTDFIKTGIMGKEREIKLNRLIAIEGEG